ncbi:MAG: hypothetical protein ABSD97_00900 [Acidimicrobiales bacterium]|jgi:hypothetical protein
MRISHPVRLGVAAAVIASGSFLFAMSAGASTAASSSKITQLQQKLEQQLTYRVNQLQVLSTDVTKATSLTPSDASTLAARLTAATASINTLLAQVPNDNTMAELRAAQQTMIQGNRVFAVLTPQVFQVIEADTIAAQAATMQAGEPALLAEINTLEGQPGYANALKHDTAYVAQVNLAAADSEHVSTVVIAQLPQDFPGDTQVFVNANHQLLDADIALARANYDASVIGLASGGYTGS